MYISNNFQFSLGNSQDSTLLLAPLMAWPYDYGTLCDPGTTVEPEKQKLSPFFVVKTLREDIHKNPISTSQSQSFTSFSCTLENISLFLFAFF